jgi:hypothetical protein
VSLPEQPKKPRCRALDSNYDQQRKSRKQEERVAKRVGGRRQPASGALPVPSLKGDIREDRFLIEAKRTDAKSLSIKSEWLMKIESQAEAVGKLPAVSIEIAGTLPMAEKDWCLIPMHVFRSLLDKGRE